MSFGEVGAEAVGSDPVGTEGRRLGRLVGGGYGDGRHSANHRDQNRNETSVSASWTPPLHHALFNRGKHESCVYGTRQLKIRQSH